MAKKIGTGTQEKRKYERRFSLDEARRIIQVERDLQEIRDIQTAIRDVFTTPPRTLVWLESERQKEYNSLLKHANDKNGN